MFDLKEVPINAWKDNSYIKILRSLDEHRRRNLMLHGNTGSREEFFAWRVFSPKFEVLGKLSMFVCRAVRAEMEILKIREG